MFDDDKYKNSNLKKYCIILNNTAYYNTRIRYSQKYFRKDIKTLIEKFKEVYIVILLFLLHSHIKY